MWWRQIPQGRGTVGTAQVATWHFEPKLSAVRSVGLQDTLGPSMWGQLSSLGQALKEQAETAAREAGLDRQLVRLRFNHAHVVNQ